MQLSFFLILFILNFFFQPSSSFLNFLSQNSQYDASKAKEFWYFAVAAYCSQSNIQSWKVSTVSDLYPNVQDITVFTNSSGDNLGYTAYEETNNLIILSIRGSANIENWFENLDAFKTTYDKCLGCYVHQGFYDAYNDLRESILTSVETLYNKHTDAQFAVIGHSLGAAIATFAFVDLYEIIGRIDYFYTFGSPRVGNQNFANYLNSKTYFGNGFKARITHHRDPVPHLPLESMDFLHIDTEIFYVEDSSSYTICNSGEDPKCANQFSIIEPEISDHLDYMAFSQPDFKANC